MVLTISRLSESARMAEVASRIDSFFDEKESLATAYGPHYAELWSAARRSSEGGKRFRPALVMNTYHALGGDRDDDVVVLATAFELLHTAFLLHDDVIDGDTVRRGRQNIIGAFRERATERGVSAESASTWGEASAILAGDLLIHAAQSHVARLNIPRARRSALLDLLEECVFVSVAGELADVAFSTTVAVPAPSDVLSMTQWKTAHYSFQAPLRAGAILAGSGEDTLNALGEYGRNIGIAFQLRDDILGAFGHERVTGKSATSDLREGKITPLMCYALQRDTTDQLREILSRANFTDLDAHRVRQILKNTGAGEFIERLIDDYAAIASAAIDSPAVPSVLRRQLDEVTRQAHARSS